MKLVRILKVTQVYPPFAKASGQGVKVQAIARHLARRGHRVTVLTTSYGQRSVARPAENTEVIYLWAALRYRMLTFSPGVVTFCLRRLREFDVAHIYGIYDTLGPVVAALCRRRRIPYVLEPIGMYRPIMRNVVLKQAYHRLFGWPLALGAAHVIATSELERDELVSEGVPASKLVIRRNGIDLPEFDLLPPRGSFRREIGVPERDTLILYLGRLSRKKGLDLLIKAFSGIASRATLAIVGPDDGDGSAEEIGFLSSQFGLNGRVKVLGPRFGPEKIAAFADADVFVLPSRSENFGNAAAEALACGVPVVVTDRCGIAPLVKRAGLVVSCEVESIRAALQRLIADQALLARLREGAAESRESLSWDQPIEQLEQIYLGLAKDGRPTG